MLISQWCSSIFLYIQLDMMSLVQDPCTNLAVVVKRKKERNIYGCWFLPHESAPSIYLVTSDSQSYLVNRHLFRLLSDSSAYKLFLFLCGANLSLTDSIATCTLQHECITLRLATPQMHIIVAHSLWRGEKSVCDTKGNLRKLVWCMVRISITLILVLFSRTSLPTTNPIRDSEGVN